MQLGATSPTGGGPDTGNYALLQEPGSPRSDDQKNERTVKRRITNSRGLPRERCCNVLVPTHSKFIQNWDTFIVVLLLVVCVTTPYDSAFGELRFNTMFCFNRFTELAFIIDMTLKFCTAIPHPVKRGCWVRDPCTIAANYLRGFFIVDLISISSLPLDTLALLGNDLWGLDYSWMKLCRAIRILRISSSFQHGQVEKAQTYFGVQNWKLAMMKLFFILAMSCHWSACIWGCVVGHGALEPNWLAALENAKGGDESLYSEKHNIYMLSLYWAIMTITTIGYGDVTPQNQTEYVLSLFLMVVMAAVWTYVIGEICAILTTLSPHLFEYFRNTDEMNWLLEEWDVPGENRVRIRRYLLESQNKVRHERNKQIVEMVSTTMQGELAQAVNRGWLEKVSYLKTMGQDEIAEISHKLDTKMFAPGEEEHFDLTLCVVERGSCGRKGRVYSRFDIWGEDMILRNPLLRDEAPTKALNYLQLLTLAWKHLEEVSNLYHTLQHSISVAKLQFGIRRGIILIARVLKELDYEGAIELKELTRRQYFQLSDAICVGAVHAGMSRATINERTGIDDPPEDDLVAVALGVDRDSLRPGTSSRLGMPSKSFSSRSLPRGISPSRSPLPPSVSSLGIDQARAGSGVPQEALSEVRAHAAELSIRMTAMNEEIKGFLAMSTDDPHAPQDPG